MMSTRLLDVGTRVILKKGDDYKSCVIERNSKIKMGKTRFNLDGLIGKKFGSLLKIGEELLPLACDIQPMEVQGCSSERTNKDLVESDQNQKMQHQQIVKMKEEGVTGEEIVEKLVENSQTFQSKTEFSQEKYIKKKKQKHVALVRVLKPTTRSVFEMFYSQSPADLGYMRVDTFSQILAYSNIVPGSNIAVIDTYKGLLVAAVLEKLAGTGSVTQLIPDNIFLRDCLKYYNLSEEVLHSHYHYNVENLAGVGVGDNRDEEMDLTPPSLDLTPPSLDTPNMDSTTTLSNPPSNPPSNTETPTRKRRRDEKKNKTPEELEAERQNRLKNSLKRQKAEQILRDKNLDGLIVSSKFHPSPLVMRLLEFMKPSRPVVVFSKFQEPLVDCYMKVKGSGRGVNLQLTETWYREYQVLPQRTHPTVKMSGNGGYLLTFTTVQSDS